MLDKLFSWFFGTKKTNDVVLKDLFDSTKKNQNTLVEPNTKVKKPRKPRGPNKKKKV